MEDKQLLAALQQHPVLDLYQLFQEVGQNSSLYALLERLSSLKEHHQLSTRLSPFKPHIEGLLAQFDGTTPDSDILKAVALQSEIQQRGHSMSRYIMTSDNHRHFSPNADLVMFGDSITEWAPWADIFRDVSMVNRGLAGDTTTGMLHRIDTTLNVKPKLVCFMAGINDLAQGYDVDHIYQNYIDMLKVWQENDIRILVQSTLYVGSKLQGLNTSVELLNSKISEYCSQQGIAFLDVNSVLSPNQLLSNEYSCDDLHLNAKAYQAWSKVLQPKIEELLN
ncbi:GDSL-type esterase/lipase family protein [Vibrio splendidus]|uniref:SGNH/GDSL hydrolase family protein n=1 Tax=Vibrio splendidus TaxID=29497 RepID=UPI0024699144|nr:SGNH/GDSL hydrolase family protein [Vibrio splendidus]MDH5910991.1 GDSL-type esterase/lipase family protein [Vibrio splendidus]MDH5944092.1 GDSL-type esterase/lipase family protein [Vibrio splendidus]MDH5984624.1 GDSL-type esterase/lipase family protein [Vibrio splendidus]MDH5991635.1 GDSL-type esterase/lipase family protein [Vibrio splendidus]MDH6006950.1 GDSL-type esterase/lipase family protein [Vibrio splendidus]